MNRRDTDAHVQLYNKILKRRKRATAMSWFVAPEKRQAFIYDRTYKDEIEAVAFPMLIKSGGIPDFANGRSFMERMRSLWLVHPNPLLSIVADKASLGAYADLVGSSIKPVDRIAVFDTPEALYAYDLPDKFMLKVNNGTSKNLLHTPEHPVSQRQLRKFIRQKWPEDFWRRHSELHYRDIPKKLVMEEVLEPHKEIEEISIFCAMGEPYIVNAFKFIPEKVQGYFSTSGDPCRNPSGSEKPNTFGPRLPDSFDEMMESARRLSKPFLHARVDFMCCNGRTVLGEITLSPGGFRSPYTPREKEMARGERLDMSQLPRLLEEGLDLAAKLGWPTETSFGHFAGDPRLSTVGQ